MSTEKEKLNVLISKVEELLTTLNKVTDELRVVSASMKSLAVANITQPAQQTSTAKPLAPSATPPVAPQTSEKKRTIPDLQMSFPEELEAKLTFEEKGDFIIIKPKQFLGSDNFAKIASVIRGMGGEYISAGKDSHFRVLQKKA